MFRDFYQSARVECLLAFSFCAIACTGQLTDPGAQAGKEASGGTDDDEIIAPSDDPGFKGIHRLSSREYDNTVRDLVGTSLRPGDGFLNETGFGFDNVAANLGMTPGQYAKYFVAATDIAAEVFSTPALAASVLVCDPGVPDEACAREIIDAFGLRAFRRPLMPEEVTTYLGVYQRAVDLELTHPQATEQVVRAFLASAEFLYRMEFDEDPNSSAAHPVSEYEMASRLSYFLWSTMPTPELLQLAADGTIMEGENLDGVVASMLNHEWADTLVDAFAWQWLGMRDLESHAVLGDVMPEWNEDLRGQMLEEGRDYFYSFLREERPWPEFLTGEVQARDDALTSFYGGTDSGRFGFLGLGGFLTVSSFAHRTSPTFRAKWILEELLCDPPAPPPPGAVIGELEDAEDLANEAAKLENVRERLELHRSDPSCAGCHSAMDPLGMALEHFDAIGRYRAEYDNGDAIDPTGAMPDGTEFDGLPSLAEALADDERFLACTAEKALIYGIGRGVTKNDEGHLADIVARFKAAESQTFAALIQELIRSVPFTERRGGSE